MTTGERLTPAIIFHISGGGLCPRGGLRISVNHAILDVIVTAAGDQEHG